MPLSPPTLTWQIKFRPASYVLSPGKVSTHRVGHERPVGAPSGLNSVLVRPSASLTHRLPVYPRPQPSWSPVAGKERSTSPAAAGVMAWVDRAENSSRVSKELGLAEGLGVFSAEIEAAADCRPPPVSCTVKSRLAEPVL